MTRSRRRKLKRMAMRGVPIASTMLVGLSPVLAQQMQPSQQGQTGGLQEIIVTAQKREESLQDVPLSITAIGTERLEELGVTDFGDYARYLPSVSYQTLGPGFALIYMRGVASGENGNHSTSLPTVGVYLDEQPITTIQGPMDVHIYDVARVEALAGPQGTLYGASSQSGTIRIITNKPDPSRFEAGYDFEGNTLEDGDTGYVAEGFANLPIGESAAVRLVGWYRHDGGYIDNVPGTRTFPTSGACISNAVPPHAGCVPSPAKAREDYNDSDTYGARAALRIDLDDNWTVTPSIMAQEQRTNGRFAFDPKIGDLAIKQFYPQKTRDEWYQAALTVTGRVSNFDVVYAGAYLDRDDVVNSDYSDYAYFYDVLAGYGEYWTDDAGNPLADPSQYIEGTDGYTKMSHELRIASPQESRVRFVAGLFTQRQTHAIFQNYKINGLAESLSVTGWPDTIWLTNQDREDRERAVFGELSFDLTDRLTLTGGLRYFEAENSLRGFFGFNANYSTNYGEALCFSQVGLRGSPCTNLDASVEETGTIPKVNVTYEIDDDRMVYATFSRGFRPGGINRNGTVPPYEADYLNNYELGWKTSWAGNRLRLNGALFYEDFSDIQFSFLPPSGAGLTVVRNAGSAEIRGIEADLAWVATDSLMITGGLAWLDTELTEDYFLDPSSEVPDAPRGSPLPVAPEFKGNVSARYDFRAGAFDAHVQGSVVYNGSSWSDLMQSDRETLGEQDAYTITDFSAGLQRGTYAFELYVNNAFDERAEVYKVADCVIDVCGVNPYVFTTRPRTFGLRFRQKF